LQRLFSTFANEWPGFGLLVQRLVAGIALLCRAIVMLDGSPATTHGKLHIAGAILGVFILVGFWTPIAGSLIAAVELWIALAGGGDAGISILLAVLGGTLAMIGPGAWSIDARLFGRKQIPP
jgi:putative oxidoreductase